MENKDIYDTLVEYCSGDYIPMHMPGAKRNTELFKMNNPYGLDITEIDGFDNMHHAEGIIKKAFERAAHLFGADETLFLVNGSSVGLLSAICGATKKGDTVIAARNCHRAVYNALYLNELKPVYVYPEIYENKNNKINTNIDLNIYGKIRPDDIEEKLKQNPKTSAVIITSPTYEGIISDVKAIAAIVHKYGAVLIVDEAHGAHFPFHKIFPASAVKCGADVVIQSIHKTLPSFTQTALLHINGDRTDRQRIKRYWDMYQSTSPSYLLMAGIDRCMTFLEEQGDKAFDIYIKNLLELRDKLSALKNISLLPVDDVSKIVLAVPDGKKLYQTLLEKYHIQLEMAAENYVIAMTSVGDKESYYNSFIKALQEIDNSISHTVPFSEQDKSKNKNIFYDNKESKNDEVWCGFCEAKIILSPFKAVEKKEEQGFDLVDITDSLGRVAAEGICFYPPGIPLINPGEYITKNVIDTILSGISQGLEVIGVHSDINNKGVMIQCLK